MKMISESKNNEEKMRFEEGFMHTILEDGTEAHRSPYVHLGEEGKHTFLDISKSLKVLSKWYSKHSKKDRVDPSAWNQRAQFLQDMGEEQSNICAMLNRLECEKYYAEKDGQKND